LSKSKSLLSSRKANEQPDEYREMPSKCQYYFNIFPQYFESDPRPREGLLKRGSVFTEQVASRPIVNCGNPCRAGEPSLLCTP